MKKTAYRTAQTSIRPGPLAQAFEALELAGKNLRNTGIFLIKNVLSSFEKNEAGIYVLKTGLHANQTQAIAEIEKAIAACNATRQSKNLTKEAELSKLEKLHAEGKSGLNDEEIEKQRKSLAPAKLFDSLKSKVPNPWIVLDGSVFDKALRTHKDEKGQLPFAALPAKFSEQIGIGIRNDFSNWRKSLKAYSQNPAAFKAKPEMPGYLGKRALAMCKIFAGAVGSRLPSIEGRSLFLDYDKTIPLPEEAFTAYAAFDVGKAGESHSVQLSGLSRRRAGHEPSAKPLQIGKPVEYRLVPGRLGASSFQSVREVHIEIRDESFLGKTLKSFEARPEAKKSQSFEDFAKENLASLAPKDFPACSGVDLGMNNLASIGHSSGRDAWILSAARIERKLKLFDEKIDARISFLSLAAPASIQALIAKRASLGDIEDKGSKKLSEAEWKLLGLHDASAQKDARLCRLRDERERFLNDAIHQASLGIIREIQAAGSELVIIGQNKLWKSGADMGSTQNRRFHRLPHAKLVEQILIKAEAASILAICVEESYTSRTSFAAHEPLPNHSAKAKSNQKTTIQKQTKEKPAQIQGEKEQAKPRRRAPKGAKSSSRHQMQTPRQAMALSFGKAGASGNAGARSPRLPSSFDVKKWTRLHADLNGAYNIIRKALPAFSAVGSGASAPSPSFRLHWLSAKGPKAFAPKLGRQAASTSITFEPGQGNRRVKTACS